MCETKEDHEKYEQRKADLHTFVRENSIDLDDHVIECKAQEASKLNNAGRGAQLEYMIEHGGLDWAEELLKGF